jgi:hypothetical protein
MKSAGVLNRCTDVEQSSVAAWNRVVCCTKQRVATAGGKYGPVLAGRLWTQVLRVFRDECPCATYRGFSGPGGRRRPLVLLQIKSMGWNEPHLIAKMLGRTYRQIQTREGNVEILVPQAGESARYLLPQLGWRTDAEVAPRAVSHLPTTPNHLF